MAASLSNFSSSMWLCSPCLLGEKKDFELFSYLMVGNILVFLVVHAHFSQSFLECFQLRLQIRPCQNHLWAGE